MGCVVVRTLRDERSRLGCRAEQTRNSGAFFWCHCGVRSGLFGGDSGERWTARSLESAGDVRLLGLLLDLRVEAVLVPTPTPKRRNVLPSMVSLEQQLPLRPLYELLRMSGRRYRCVLLTVVCRRVLQLGRLRSSRVRGWCVSCVFGNARLLN